MPYPEILLLDHCVPSKVRLKPLSAPDEKFPQVLGLWGCSLHQAEVEGFTAQVNEVLVSTQTFHPPKSDPITLVHFGLGRMDEFEVDFWRASLSSALSRVRGYKVDTISLEWPGGHLRSPNSEMLFEMGRITRESINATWFRQDEVVKYIHLIVSSARADEMERIESGIHSAIDTVEKHQ